MPKAKVKSLSDKYLKFQRFRAHILELAGREIDGDEPILEPTAKTGLEKRIVLYYTNPAENSDKIYEIDLIWLGFAPGSSQSNKKADPSWLVKFAYGRRGGTMKKGTKTPKPVSYFTAERLFNELETEKRQKGYTTNERGR